MTPHCRRFAGLAAAILLVALAPGCGGDPPPTPSTAGPATTSPFQRCDKKPDDKPAKRVRRCAEGSVALVRTPDAGGTGVVIVHDAKRYLLTNMHVVDPYNSADITIEGRVTKGLPVVGVDLLADVAVLGPFEDGDAPPLEIVDGTSLENGDDVYLLGFPGETEQLDDPDLEATMASGIVSRIRKVSEFQQTYIQTDAAIAHGQSGGPLLNADAQVVGMSGLSFADDKFGLALSGVDLERSISRILDGEGDREYLGLPVSGDSGTTKSGSVQLNGVDDAQTLYVPGASTARVLNFTVDVAARPVVVIGDPGATEPLAITTDADAIYAEAAGEPSVPSDPIGSTYSQEILDRETSPGHWTVPVPADTPLQVVILAPLADGPTAIAWTSDLPTVAKSHPLQTLAVKVGDTRDAVIGPFDSGVDVTIDLTKGEAVELSARTPQGDVGFAVIPPGVEYDPFDLTGTDIEEFEDTGDGLYGTDATTTYTPKQSGTFRLKIWSNTGVTTKFRFSSQTCPANGCPKHPDRGAPADGAKSPDTTTTTAG